MTLFFVLSSITISFLLHILIWRIRIPKKQKNALIMIFLLPVFFLSAQSFLIELMSLEQWLLYFLCVLVIMGSYLISYTLIEAEGPTFLILLSMHAKGLAGVTPNELGRVITNELFVDHRLKGLVADRLVQEVTSGQYKITQKGRLVLMIFVLVQKIFFGRYQGG